MRKTVIQLLFLCLCFFVSSNTISVNAMEETHSQMLSSEIVDSGNISSTIKWEYYSDGTMRIIGAGDMVDYDFAEIRPWESYANMIVRVEFDDDITRIGSYSFSCSSSPRNISSVKYPASLKSIGKWAFYGHPISEMILPESVEVIEACAFRSGIGVSTSQTIKLGSRIKNIEFAAFDPFTVNWKGYSTIYIYGSECVLDYDSLPLRNATIYGWNDSTAEAYAKKYGLTFIGEDCLHSKYDLAEGQSISGYSFYYCASCGKQKIEANTYSLFLDANGGVCAETERLVTYDREYGTLPIPERLGYLFLGWYFDNGIAVEDTSIVQIEQNETLFAHWQKNTSPKVESFSLTLDDYRIGMNFYLSELDEILDGGYIKVNNSIYQVTDVIKGDEIKVSYYINAKELDDILSVSIYNSGHEQIPLTNEQCVDGMFKTSVREYINQARGIDDSLDQLLISLDIYGKCAQEYFGFNATNQSQFIEEIEDIEKYEKVIVGTMPKEVTYLGTSLVLNESISIRHYFSVYNKAYEYTFFSNNNHVLPVFDKDICYIEISNIKACDFDKLQILKIMDDYSVCTFKYSVLSYISDASMQDDDLLSNLVKSIFGYHQAVKKYSNK